jgi:hypothetical protein
MVSPVKKVVNNRLDIAHSFAPVEPWCRQLEMDSLLSCFFQKQHFFEHLELSKTADASVLQNYEK